MPDCIQENYGGYLAVPDRWAQQAVEAKLGGMKNTPFTPGQSSSSTAPSQDEIALRAHQLWCQQGCPQGHDLDNWLEAEIQLLNEYAGRRSSHPVSEDVSSPKMDRGDSPFSDLADEAPLATKVDEQVVQRGRTSGRESATSLDI